MKRAKLWLIKSFQRTLIKEILGEFFGTFLMVTIGIGSVASAVLVNSFSGLWQVASIWGFGVAIAIYTTGSLSGAHLNPSITIAFALVRRKQFSAKKIPHYLLSQLVGSTLAGCLTYAMWSPFITEFELANNLQRGEEGSHLSAMMFGEYFPNPALKVDPGLVTPALACGVEAFGTFVLAFVVFALTDPNNSQMKKSESMKTLTPIIIGFTVAVLISIFAPLTQAGWNPARDFGPRLVAYFAGWKKHAIPGPNNGFWVYIVGPIIGGVFGAMFYQFCLGLTFETTTEEKEVDLQEFNKCKPIGQIDLSCTNSEEQQCLILQAKKD